MKAINESKWKRVERHVKQKSQNEAARIIENIAERMEPERVEPNSEHSEEPEVSNVQQQALEIDSENSVAAEN